MILQQKLLQATNFSKEEGLFNSVFEDQSLNMGDSPTTATYFASAEGSRWHHARAGMYVGTRCYDSNRSRKRGSSGRLDLCLVLLSGELTGLPKDCLTSPETWRFLLKLYRFAQYQPFHHSVPGRTRTFLSHPNIWAILGMKSKCEHEIHVWVFFFQRPWKPEASDSVETV